MLRHDLLTPGHHLPNYSIRDEARITRFYVRDLLGRQGPWKSFPRV